MKRNLSDHKLNDFTLASYMNRVHVSKDGIKDPDGEEHGVWIALTSNKISMTIDS